MTTVRTQLGQAVDAIQRVPVACWLRINDDPNGFPNYPLIVDDNNVEAQSLATATGCIWDGSFSAATAALLNAIGADPTRIPADTTNLTRTALFALYPEVAQ